MSYVIDTMPTLTEVENATPRQIVEWQLYLRPTMSNEELPVVKLIAMKYDQLPPNVREHHGAELRQQHA